MPVRIVLVGGFLGAGKTHLLFEAAQQLAARGKRVGLITNDQAPELVDTRFLELSQGAVREVSGSCFCCNFGGFIDAILGLVQEQRAEIIMAEPVGSCTDLSATVVQPLKDQFGSHFVVAPLTVLVDPHRLTDLLEGRSAGLHPSAVYILRKQLEEADIIAISKTDLLTREQVEALKQRAAAVWPQAQVMTLSAKTGAGLEDWLQEVTTRKDAGKNMAQVDYDIYAQGEAVLGWLNATALLQGEAVDWDQWARDLLEALSRRFDDLEAPVGHVKLMLQAGSKYVMGNLTGRRETISLRRSAGVGPEARLTLNARVQMTTEELERIVLEELARACGTGIQYEIEALQCLSPGYPQPTYRYDRVVPGNTG